MLFPPRLAVLGTLYVVNVPKIVYSCKESLLDLISPSRPVKHRMNYTTLFDCLFKKTLTLFEAFSHLLMNGEEKEKKKISLYFFLILTATENT